MGEKRFTARAAPAEREARVHLRDTAVRKFYEVVTL